MTDPEKLRGMLDAACRASDAQVDQLVKQNNELRSLRRIMWHAYTQLCAGRADGARRTLKNALAAKR